MKKNIEKILGSASIIVALVLIIILLVTAFGGIKQDEFDNDLVKGLFVTLGILYLVLAGGQLAMLFLDNDAVKEIVIRSEKDGNCKATLGVIRKLTKDTCKGVEGVRCGKVGLIVNEYGVRLRVNVKVVDRDVAETETYLRTLLEEVYLGALGFRFNSIEIKITSLQARFVPDKEKVKAEAEAKLAEMQPHTEIGETEDRDEAAAETPDGEAREEAADIEAPETVEDEATADSEPDADTAADTEESEPEEK